METTPPPSGPSNHAGLVLQTLHSLNSKLAPHFAGWSFCFQKGGQRRSTQNAEVAVMGVGYFCMEGRHANGVTVMKEHHEASRSVFYDPVSDNTEVKTDGLRDCFAV